jgi:hypothetical protein
MQTGKHKHKHTKNTHCKLDICKLANTNTLSLSHLHAHVCREAERPAKRGGRLTQQGKPAAKQRRVVVSDEDEDMMEEDSESAEDSGSEFDAGRGWFPWGASMLRLHCRSYALIVGIWWCIRREQGGTVIYEDSD